MAIISAPAEFAFTCLQGSPFVAVLQFYQDEALQNPVDFSGWSFLMQVREGVADSNAPIIASFSSEESTAEEARIIFIAEASDGTPDIDGLADPTNGMIALKLSSADTTKMKATKAPKLRTFPAVSNFFYDIEGTAAGGQPQRLGFGTFDLKLEVTRVS